MANNGFNPSWRESFHFNIQVTNLVLNYNFLNFDSHTRLCKNVTTVVFLPIVGHIVLNTELT